MVMEILGGLTRLELEDAERVTADLMQGREPEPESRAVAVLMPMLREMVAEQQQAARRSVWG